MRGVNVCYHHGGRSLRGFVHPNYKHGFYCKVQPLELLVAFGLYRREVQQQQIAAVLDHLQATMPCQTRADYRRFMAAYWAAVVNLPDVKLTAELADYVMQQWTLWLRGES
jgi:hypothetical protein